MAEQRTYPKHCCFFCKRIISGHGAAKASHYRTHVRSGEAEEVGPFHPEYRGQVEFLARRGKANV